MSYAELIENKSSQLESFESTVSSEKRMLSFKQTKHHPQREGGFIPQRYFCKKLCKDHVKIPFCINEQITTNEVMAENPNVKFVLCKS